MPEIRQGSVEPYSGVYKEIQTYLQRGRSYSALRLALKWKKDNPENTLALVALGDAAMQQKDRDMAIRAYSSLIDYFPMRADIRRFASEKLIAIGEYKIAIDSFQKALEERPDHPSVYHLLSMAYLSQENYKQAATILLKGLNKQFDSRFIDAHQILYDDLDLVYTIAKRNESKDMPFFEKISKEYKIKELEKEIKFILVWETDANDVDFHVYDRDKNHAFYSKKVLPSGGELYADITNGYGPECFRIVQPNGFPYKLEAHYYNKGPMGFGMGALQIIRFNGFKKVKIETRPFVIMNDGAFIDLGIVKR